MCEETINLTGKLESDIETFSCEISKILDDKLRCKRIENMLLLKEHIEYGNYCQMKIGFCKYSDIHTILIKNTLYYIHRYGDDDNSWAVWNDLTNLEIVLHPDWAYRDLLGAMALLEQGAKARFWNSTVIGDRAANELGYDRLGFKIKGVRLRDSKAMFR